MGLHPGSTRLEIKPAIVRFCVEQGLVVVHYDADSERWALFALGVSGRRYRSLIVSRKQRRDRAGGQ